MELIHKLKSAQHTIPIDLEAALDPEAFATYTNEYGDGSVEHTSIGWELQSLHDMKYKDHRFELRWTPDTIDKVIEVLTTLKQRFAVDEIP